ncbi:hypothetical protein R3P38DRAFT_3370769 [Favolaschia claudopus]|uniref:Uncharacterized protein n=1 Tax=Favolaschia claudopus TaxID=2862362 RepID=A0AAW0A0A3_9AGAR
MARPESLSSSDAGHYFSISRKDAEDWISNWQSTLKRRRTLSSRSSRARMSPLESSTPNRESAGRRDVDVVSDEALSSILNRNGSSIGSDPDESRLDVEEEFSFVDSRQGPKESLTGDDINCLNSLTAYSAIEIWNVDMRLTLLWCFAFEARFRRRGPALDLWLAIISGSRERINWGMWEDGDEAWLRDMITDHTMMHRFQVATLKLSSADWMRARDALASRAYLPEQPNPLRGWSREHRILRIAWCALTDSVLGREYPDLMHHIDCWNYYTCPFRSSNDQNMKLRLHDSPGCLFSSCKMGVWEWFKSAILDYDSTRIGDIIGCCDNCINRAFSALRGSRPTSEIKEPAVWPVIIWVAFQLQTSTSSSASTAENMNILLDLIQSESDACRSLWTWDDVDQQLLHQRLVSCCLHASSWIDRYPPSWRVHIAQLASNDWAKLEVATRHSQRSREPSLVEYDTTIRIGAMVAWASSCLKSTSQGNAMSVLLSLEKFLPQGFDKLGFLRCLTEQRVPLRTRHYELNLGPETVDWHHPHKWLESNQ